jgi:hypothetical protein
MVRLQHAVTGARDLLEEIIAIQTAKSNTPGSTNDMPIDHDSVRNRYELWGAYTCVKCAWRAITYARLERRGTLRTQTVPPPTPLATNTNHSMSKRRRLNVSSCLTIPHDNHVNDTETHRELMTLRLELAHCPLSAHVYRGLDSATTPFALKISSATQIRHRPRDNPSHHWIQQIIGQTLPYGSPLTSYYIKDVTVNLDQYTIWGGRMILQNVTSSSEILFMSAGSFIIVSQTCKYLPSPLIYTHFHKRHQPPLLSGRRLHISHPHDVYHTRQYNYTGICLTPSQHHSATSTHPTQPTPSLQHVVHHCATYSHIL